MDYLPSQITFSDRTRDKDISEALGLAGPDGVFRYFPGTSVCNALPGQIVPTEVYETSAKRQCYIDLAADCLCFFNASEAVFLYHAYFSAPDPAFPYTLSAGQLSGNDQG